MHLFLLLCICLLKDIERFLDNNMIFSKYALYKIENAFQCNTITSKDLLQKMYHLNFEIRAY